MSCRARRAGLGWMVAIASAGSWLGCNALAGINEARLEDTTPSDGGADTVVTIGPDGGLDGAADAAREGAVNQMECRFLQQPILLRDLSTATPGNRFFAFQDGIPIVAVNGSSGALVAVLHNATGGADSGGPQTYQELLPTSVNFQGRSAAVQGVPVRAQGGIGKIRTDLPDRVMMLSNTYDQTANDNTSLLKMDVLSMQGWQSSFTVMKGLPSVSNVRSTFVPLNTSGDVYFVATLPSGTGSEVYAGVATSSTPAALVKFGNVPGKDFDIFHLGTNVYLVEGGGPKAGGGAVNGYILPDNGQLTALTPKPLPAVGTSTQTLLLDVQPGYADKSKIAVFGADLTFLDSSHLQLELLTGLLSPVELDGFKLTTPPLARGRVLTPSEVPINSGNHIAFQDEVALIGGPGTNDPVFDGLNFLWVNAAGKTQFQASGATRLLPGKTIAGAGVALADRSSQGARFFVTWVEDIVPDGGSEYQVLFANDLLCAPK